MKTINNNFDNLLPPSPVEFTPYAIGWKVSGVIIICILLLLIIWWIIRYRRNRYRKEALKLISELHTKGQPRLIQIDKIIRRTAFTAYQDSRVKSMTQDSWYNFLLKHAPTYHKETDFIPSLSELFYGVENNEKEILISKYEEYARFWIRQHEL
ncbi:DUF4381 domain-containing protein [Prolixibacteraceae bacterium]|nr:DUF4381 domain-containing protein [Prolixibacteraceae bacterium]